MSLPQSASSELLQQVPIEDLAFSYLNTICLTVGQKLEPLLLDPVVKLFVESVDLIEAFVDSAICADVVAFKYRQSLSLRCAVTALPAQIVFTLRNGSVSQYWIANGLGVCGTGNERVHLDFHTGLRVILTAYVVSAGSIRSDAAVPPPQIADQSAHVGDAVALVFPERIVYF